MLSCGASLTIVSGRCPSIVMIRHILHDRVLYGSLNSRSALMSLSTSGIPRIFA